MGYELPDKNLKNEIPRALQNFESVRTPSEKIEPVQ